MDPIVLEGLAECLISTVLFGSAYVPIKKFEFGDGIYSLQIRSISILCCGFLTFAYTGFSHFYPIAMLGGLIWTGANLIIMPCIGELGLGMAVLLYSFTNCLTNWVTGTYGLFWTNARPANNDIMNYVGLVGLLIGGSLVTMIKPEQIHAKLSTITTISAAISTDGILPSSINPIKSIDTLQPTKKHWIDVSNINWRRIIAIFVALFAGLLFGQDPTPIIVVQDRYEGVPQHGVYYIFSFYFGIFLSSSIVKNKPFVNPELTLASLFSGVIWALGQGLLIISMGHLSISVAGPIASVAPACVASIWSVFYFKEIKGRKNMIILCTSIGITLFGTILISLSK